MMQATSRYRSLHRAEARRQAALQRATVAASEVAQPAKPLRSNKAVRRHVRRALHAGAAAGIAAGLAATAFSGPPAHADGIPSKVPDHCVTQAEAGAFMSKADKGIHPTAAQVAELFGTRGKKDLGRSTHEKVVKVYDACHEGDITDGFWRVAYYRPTMKALGYPYMSLFFTIILIPIPTPTPTGAP